MALPEVITYDRAGRVTEVEQELKYVPGALYTVRNMLGVDPDGGGVPDATEIVKGKAELATVAEAVAGVDTTRIVTPAGLAAAIVAAIPSYGQDEIRAIVSTGAPSIVVHRNTTAATLAVSSPGVGQVNITADLEIFTAKTFAYGGVAVYGGSDFHAEVRKISTTVVRVYIFNPHDGNLSAAAIDVPVLIDILP